MFLQWLHFSVMIIYISQPINWMVSFCVVISDVPLSRKLWWLKSTEGQKAHKFIRHSDMSVNLWEHLIKCSVVLRSVNLNVNWRHKSGFVFLVSIAINKLFCVPSESLFYQSNCCDQLGQNYFTRIRILCLSCNIRCISSLLIRLFLAWPRTHSSPQSFKPWSLRPRVMMEPKTGVFHIKNEWNGFLSSTFFLL